jgi:CheY-like chemotaxis protein
VNRPPDILIVEDEPVVTRAADRILETLGLRSASAKDVEEAAAWLERQAFRVVVTDLKLPGRSGFELLGIAARKSPAPPVIIITGYATTENALESFRLGAFDFIPKPFDVPELLGVVQRALRCFDRIASDAAPATAGDTPRERRYFLGQHSWVLLDEDGSGTLGVAATFQGVVGVLTAIEFPTPGEGTVQGQCFCLLSTIDRLVHRVWAPLSGQVIATNQDVVGELELIDRDPYHSGWLARIIPAALDKELPNLTRRY